VFEYLNLVAPLDPIRWTTYTGAAVTVLLPALFGLLDLDLPVHGVVAGVFLSIALGPIGAFMLRDRGEITMRIGVGVFGAIYIGMPLGLFVALRELPHGAGAVTNIIVGTWAFDTFAYAGGKMWGSHPVAPRTSPNKTIEGLVIGLVFGTLSVALAGVYMDWLSLGDSLIIGLVVCGFAYLGDLFESLIKRDVGVKDSGSLLAGHGGVLDRFDALFFTAAAGYLVTVWLT
jgi:phosphatidate cytidylyltransferase